ncbi:MAG: isoprenylcysteine carboxylmethyltransferase family protein [Candidatus Aminicenantes bacterium]|nr:MAG: isoprenylcysteine carboxylmethyltransferase family protein [Candidatus Aminicenantes bacterium]
MLLTPAFEIGIWNAWILQVVFYLSMFIPDFFLDKETRKKSKRMSQFPPFKKKEKVLAISTHAIIMPAVLIYSIFLPLKTGTAWLYAGLTIFAFSLAISIVTLFNIASAPADKPVTKGAYKISRHPMYFSAFLMFIGVGISCASWVVLLLAVIWIVFWRIAVPAEEQFLIELYGENYRDYMSRTPRWIGIPKSSTFTSS